MPTKIIPFAQLKTMYMESPIMSVKEFFQSIEYPYTEYVHRQCLNWRKQKEFAARNKKAIQEKIEGIIIEEAEKKRPEIERQQEKLLKMKQDIIDIIGDIVNSLKKKKARKGYTTKDIDILTKLIKTELGEPTRINKKETTNTNRSIIWKGSITPEEVQALRSGKTESGKIIQ